MNKRQRIKSWIYAICFTLMGIGALMNPDPKTRLIGFAFLFIAFFDWLRIVKDLNRRR